MTIRTIPDDVRRFIQASIDSVAQLEALLIVHEYPHIEWTVEALSARLYISPEQTSGVMSRLSENRLVIKHNATAGFRYQPESEDLRKMVDRVAEAYPKLLVPITRLIHSKEGLRIREFPDAFDFRKERS